MNELAGVWVDGELWFIGTVVMSPDSFLSLEPDPDGTYRLKYIRDGWIYHLDRLTPKFETRRMGGDPEAFSRPVVCFDVTFDNCFAKQLEKGTK